jgi:hypothetical protein
MPDLPEIQVLRIINSSEANWVLFWSVVALLIVGYLVLHRRFRKMAGLQLPTCRDCGYAIFGTHSTKCPECGADLSGAGLLPAGAVRPVGRVSAMLMWTVSAAAVASLITLISFRSNWLRLPASRTYGLRLSPISHDYDGFTLG